MTELTSVPPVDLQDVDFWAERRHANGSASFWAIGSAPRGVNLRRWESADGVWQRTSDAAGVDWLSAATADSELTVVAHDSVNTYQAPNPDLLLNKLKCGRYGDPYEEGWAFDVADFELEDEDFLFEEGQVRRYARLNDRRLCFIDSDAEPVAILVDGHDLEGTQLAELTWNNGGDPASTVLVEVRPGVAVGLHRGEISNWIQAFEFTPDVRGTALMLESWLNRADEFGSGGGAAALALEPLDPFGQLTPQGLAAWEREIRYNEESDEHVFRVAFSLPEPVRKELREVLAESDTGYVAVRNALANPLDGEWLRLQLADGNTETLW